MTISDLKPQPHDTGPMTPARAFTICELIALRCRGSGGGKGADAIASMIAEVAKAWREK